jgi:hypothetical protein
VNDSSLEQLAGYGNKTKKDLMPVIKKGTSSEVPFSYQICEITSLHQ